jgi:hypothetical protein
LYITQGKGKNYLNETSMSHNITLNIYTFKFFGNCKPIIKMLSEHFCLLQNSYVKFHASSQYVYNPKVDISNYSKGIINKELRCHAMDVMLFDTG